jgi:hypothetical protein
MEGLIGRICKPMRLKPAAAGRRRAARAEQDEAGQKSRKDLKRFEKI